MGPGCLLLGVSVTLTESTLPNDFSIEHHLNQNALKYDNCGVEINSQSLNPKMPTHQFVLCIIFTLAIYCILNVSLQTSSQESSRTLNSPHSVFNLIFFLCYYVIVCRNRACDTFHHLLVEQKQWDCCKKCLSQQCLIKWIFWWNILSKKRYGSCGTAALTGSRLRLWVPVAPDCIPII